MIMGVIVFALFWYSMVLFVTIGQPRKKPEPVDHGYPKMGYPEE